TRDMLPRKIVWKQDDITHTRFYWLAIDPADQKVDRQVIVTRAGQKVTVEKSDVPTLMIHLTDKMLDLDKPVICEWANRIVYEGTPARTIAVMSKTLEDRGDAEAMFTSEVIIRNP